MHAMAMGTKRSSEDDFEAEGMGVLTTGRSVYRSRTLVVAGDVHLFFLLAPGRPTEYVEGLVTSCVHHAMEDPMSS